MKLFDSHAHLFDERFNDDRDAVTAALPEQGLLYVMEVGCDVRDDKKMLAFVERYPFLYAALGMHPHTAADMTDALYEELRNDLKHPRVRALGEIGLDYHYDFSPRDVQKNWFAAQLVLAGETDLPVILHSREATADTLDILRAHRDALKGGVMHCFSGSYETAKICLDLGLYVAFGGALTFKNAEKLRDVAKRLPLDRLLVETDCPYMTPEPHRRERCTPAYVRITAECLAALHGRGAEEIARITCENAMALYKIG